MASARNVSFRISLQWLIHIVNSVDKTKLSCNTLTDAAPQFLKKRTPWIRVYFVVTPVRYEVGQFFFRWSNSLTTSSSARSNR